MDMGQILAGIGGGLLVTVLGYAYAFATGQTKVAVLKERAVTNGMRADTAKVYAEIAEKAAKENDELRDELRKLRKWNDQLCRQIRNAMLDPIPYRDE